MAGRARWVVLVVALSTIIAVVAITYQVKFGDVDPPRQAAGSWPIHDVARPQPVVVIPGPSAGFAAPPSDAIVLLGSDGNLSAWEAVNGKPASWPAPGGILQTGKGNIQTKDSYRDIQLHLEFATPAEVKGDGQDRGNSGVFLAGRFEIQVLDSYGNTTYPDGQAAAMYGQFPPLVNASRPPGEWQVYDITFTAPRFSGNTLAAPAIVTVMHNGIVVHHARAFSGPTAHGRIGPYVPESSTGPIRLQDHSNPVRYRNIWLRRLD